MRSTGEENSAPSTATFARAWHRKVNLNNELAEVEDLSEVGTFVVSETE